MDAGDFGPEKQPAFSLDDEPHNMLEKFIFICMPVLIEDSDTDGDDDDLIEAFERRLTNLKVVQDSEQVRSDGIFDDVKCNMEEFVELDTIKREVGDLAAALRIHTAEYFEPEMDANCSPHDPADALSQNLGERIEKVYDRLNASLKMA